MSWSLFRSVALLSSPSCLLHLRRAKAKQAPRLTRPCQVLFSKKVDLFFLPFGRSARGYKPVTVKTWVLFKSVRQQVANHPPVAAWVNVCHGLGHDLEMLFGHHFSFLTHMYFSEPDLQSNQPATLNTEPAYTLGCRYPFSFFL